MFGEKQGIKGNEDIRGFAKTSTGGAIGAGLLDSLGGAAGSGYGAAVVAKMIPALAPFAIKIALVVGALNFLKELLRQLLGN